MGISKGWPEWLGEIQRWFPAHSSISRGGRDFSLVFCCYHVMLYIETILKGFIPQKLSCVVLKGTFFSH